MNTYINIYTYIYVYIFIHTHTHTYIYIYIYIRGAFNKFTRLFCTGYKIVVDT